MRTYIIARMYAGSYLDDKMGGEAINLLHDDRGNNYVFVGPYGFIDRKYNNTVEAIVLTRLVKDGCFEVLGIAKIGKNGQVTYQNGNTLKKRFQNGVAVIDKYAEENDIKYGGISYKEIVGGSFSGADITFRSEKLLLPNKDVFITDCLNKNYIIENSTVINLDDKRFPKQSLHAYITDEENPHSFEAIMKLMNDENVWDGNRTNKIQDNQVIDQHFNFMDVIHKSFDELAYSNLFAYIFKTFPDVFISFVDKVLKVKISEPYVIEREKAHIDLWIEDKENIIVIENKIKSGVNGILDKCNLTESGQIKSQLIAYFEYAKKVKKDKKVHCYLFVPNYNKIRLKDYLGGDEYKEIKYSEIYKFFANINVKDIYFTEFVNALYKHTKDRENDAAEEIAYRFLNIIKRLKSKNENDAKQ